MTLLPGRAAYWHEARTLLLADLHLGKVETFQSAGIPLPGAVGEHDLRRLGALIEFTEAKRALIVGDLLHAPAGLTDSLIRRVAAWRSRVLAEIEIVPGNHDTGLHAVAPEWRMRILPAAHEEPPFRFTHEPSARAGVFTWNGHLHPAVRIGGRADGARLPCFRVSSSGATLPAFTRFAAGSTRAAPDTERVFAATDTEVFEAPHRRRPTARPRR